MKNLIRLEEFTKIFFAYWLSIEIGYAWWVFFAWLLVPDLSMIGYVINTQVGAWLYNFVHHQMVAIVVGVIGYYLEITSLELAGIVLFGHSAMDRAFGYGLKHEDSFIHTHLGLIGKANK
jgi:hypothetical protein